MAQQRRLILKLTSQITAFVSLAILAAVSYTFLLSAFQETETELGERGPSSVRYGEDGEPVFWDQSIEEIEQSAAKDPAFREVSLQKKSKEIFKHLGPLSADEAENKTGFPAKRAYRVIFNFANFKDAVTRMNQSGQRLIVFHLFNDIRLPIRLERPSSYSVNTGVYWGQVEGDSGSRVRVFVEGSSMNATIETKGRVFKIVAADGLGPEHVVLEER